MVFMRCSTRRALRFWNMPNLWRQGEKPSVVIRGRPLIGPVRVTGNRESHHGRIVRLARKGCDSASILPRGILVRSCGGCEFVRHKDGELRRVWFPDQQICLCCRHITQPSEGEIMTWVEDFCSVHEICRSEDQRDID